MTRLQELQQNLDEINSRIQNACTAAGRDSSEVTLIAVSKTWPAADIRLLHELGIRDFGESRDQEAFEKVAALADLEIKWHFIGQVQSNKLNHIAQYAHYVHALDRAKAITGLNEAAAKHNRQINALLQISLDGDISRGGVAIESAMELSGLISSLPSLDFAGVMAVAPLNMEPDMAFSRLNQVANEIRTKYPTAKMVSAGMSNDLESAVNNGATHLRIGSALLGNRE